jgi:hypothetical protein
MTVRLHGINAHNTSRGGAPLHLTSGNSVANDSSALYSMALSVIGSWRLLGSMRHIHHSTVTDKETWAMDSRLVGKHFPNAHQTALLSQRASC